MSTGPGAIRIAMFTPLPPARSGTADYSAALIPALGKVASLEVFSSVPRGFNRTRYDAVIYQIANNPWHTDIYRLALDQPGIAVLHEANLHDLIRGMTLDRGDERAYIAEVIYEIFGGRNAGGGSEKQESLFEAPQARTFTMLRRILDASRACIVHSAYAEREARLKHFAGPIAVIPHGAAVRSLPAAECRRVLHMQNSGPIVGMFGYQRPDKRAIPCLRAFSRIARRHSKALLLIAGEGHPEVLLDPLIRELHLEGRVAIQGFQDSLESLDTCIAACDVVLNLRHPTFGETSGTMMRAFGLGRTVVVSDTGACRELPDDICLRISPDIHEEAVLGECLDWLLEDPSRTLEIGSRAREWAAEHCSWERTAGLYREFAESVSRTSAGGLSSTSCLRPACGTIAPLDPSAIAAGLAHWNAMEGPSADYFATHAERLNRTIRLIPPAVEGDCVLEIGCYMQITPLLRTILGYSGVRGCYLGKAGIVQRASVTSVSGETFECTIDLFDVEKDAFPYPDGSFATVVCGEVLEHLEFDPVHMMNEIHRVLKTDGILVLTTPNIVSLRAVAQILKAAHPASFRRYSRGAQGSEREPGHSREYTPDEIRLLLSDCGFLPIGIETGPYGETGQRYPEVERLLSQAGFPTELRGECIYAVARKEMLRRNRHPSWLYGE